MDLAERNFTELQNNVYPGRGIAAGLNASATHLVQIYWIMGRSDNSRNRIFVEREGHVWTEPADPAKVKDPSLIIYNAMRELDGVYVATNGDQTDTIIQSLRAGATLRQSLMTRQYEPDAPNCTPRISCFTSLRDGMPMIELAILKKSSLSDACNRYFYTYDQMEPGFGHMLTTYAGDGDPLPAFEGEPRLMPLQGEIAELAQSYWTKLNPENRVSLAVKFIDCLDWTSQTHIINRFG